MDSLAHPPRVQIFATDIDEEALAVARTGRYPDPLLSGLGPQRRKRFFRGDGAALLIYKEVRDMCIFSPHSVVGDPPFSRMNLVSCRNLLIYMGATLQNQVIPTFHYALRPGDYLILGSVKGISRHAHLFGAVDKKSRRHRKRRCNRSTRSWPPSMPS